MIENKIELSDASVVSASLVSGTDLKDFYVRMFPARSDLNNWRWLYRTYFFDNTTPLVLIRGGRIIAHAGMIPFRVLINGKEFTASWYVDFMVLPEFRKMGLGTLITKRLMELSDVCVAIHNESSGFVFKHLGWAGSTESYLHRYFLKPFDHPRSANRLPGFLRISLNRLAASVIRGNYRKNLSVPVKLRFEKASERSLKNFWSYSESSPETVKAVRDSEYIKWRLIDSPDSGKYSIVYIDGTKWPGALIKENESGGYKNIAILAISGGPEYMSIRCLISGICLWGMDNGYSFIRQYTSDRDMSEYLRRSLRPMVSHPYFSFYARDSKLMAMLTAGKWRWELIDSDFEWLKA